MCRDVSAVCTDVYLPVFFFFHSTQKQDKISQQSAKGGECNQQEKRNSKAFVGLGGTKKTKKK